MRLYGFAGHAIWQDKSGAGLNERLSALGLGRTYSAPLSGTATAAQNAVAEVRNPNASGKTLFFWGGDITTATAMGFSIVADGTTLNPATAPIPNLTGGAASIATFGGGSQAAPTGTSFWFLAGLAANTPWPLPPDFWYALPPNHNLQIIGQTVNTAFRANLRWVELTA